MMAVVFVGGLFLAAMLAATFMLGGSSVQFALDSLPTSALLGFGGLVLLLAGALIVVAVRRGARTRAARALERRNLAERAQREEERRHQEQLKRTALVDLLGFRSPSELATVTCDHLLALNPTKFEIAVCEVLAISGCQRIEHTGGPGDHGIDVMGLDAQGQEVVVQCKRYQVKTPVALLDVEDFIEIVTNRPGRRGLFVTTSSYPQSARWRAYANRDHVQLVDGTLLVKIIRHLALPDSGAPMSPPNDHFPAAA
jgi:restriction endonuclease Mrr